MRRRGALRLLAGLAVLPILSALPVLGARAHTPYGQWVVYRKKHLLLGCHRADPATWDAAKTVVAMLDARLPEARARVARAPHPERLASLMASDQLDLAVLAPETAAAIAAGEGSFAAYGPVALARLAALEGFVLIARADFPPAHGWLVAAALEGFAGPGAGPELPLHPGARAFLDGAPRPAG